ncbi:MAG: M23 family metallopeptidase [Candidatus Sericytochromatia bacterium]
MHRLWILTAIAVLTGCEALAPLAQDLQVAAEDADALARRKGDIKPAIIAASPIAIKDRLGLPSLAPASPVPSPRASASPSPAPSPAASPSQIPRACEQGVCLTSEQQGNQFSVYLQPGVHVDMTVTLQWTLNNMAAEFKAAEPVVLKAGQKTLVGKLRFSSNAGGTYQVNTTAVRYGDVSVTQDPYVYALPWRAGEAYACGNGWNGFGAHTGDTGQALDFLMPEGTPILAARDGVVFKVENQFAVGGNDPALGDKANLVYVRHDNGTYGRYLHFKQNGVVVALGQPVRRGQLLGYSGNTGWSTAPHLHFDVMTAKTANSDRTIGVKLQTQASQPAGEVPQQGRTYTAF